MGSADQAGSFSRIAPVAVSPMVKLVLLRLSLASDPGKVTWR